MADMSLVDFDRRLADGAQLFVYLSKAKKAGTVAAAPAAAIVGSTIGAAVGGTVTAAAKSSIPFQFAPRILNESNSMMFDEINFLQFEPLRYIQGASGRRLNVEWEYVATDSKFTGKAIAGYLQKLKSYFYEFESYGKFYPVVQFKYMHILPTLTDFRMHDISINYGQEIVSNGGDYYPLYTKVAISLSLATDIRGLYKVDPLQTLQPEWY